VEVLFVLLVSFILLRGAGLLGIRRLSSRRNAGLGALVIMFLFTGSTHFTAMKHDYAAMLPGFVPMKVSIIHMTGALQILGAVGLLIHELPSSIKFCDLRLYKILGSPAKFTNRLRRVTVVRLQNGERR
jgi:uncharacterized membrane protein